jgi:hypothetical protein
MEAINETTILKSNVIMSLMSQSSTMRGLSSKNKNVKSCFSKYKPRTLKRKMYDWNENKHKVLITSAFFCICEVKNFNYSVIDGMIDGLNIDYLKRVVGNSYNLHEKSKFLKRLHRILFDTHEKVSSRSRFHGIRRLIGYK